MPKRKSSQYTKDAKLKSKARTQERWQTLYWTHLCKLQKIAFHATAAESMYFDPEDDKERSEDDLISAEAQFQRDLAYAANSFASGPYIIENRSHLDTVCEYIIDFLDQVSNCRDQLCNKPLGAGDGWEYWNELLLPVLKYDPRPLWRAIARVTTCLNDRRVSLPPPVETPTVDLDQARTYFSNVLIWCRSRSPQDGKQNKAIANKKDLKVTGQTVNLTPPVNGKRESKSKSKTKNEPTLNAGGRPRKWDKFMEIVNEFPDKSPDEQIKKYKQRWSKAISNGEMGVPKPADVPKIKYEYTQRNQR